ncbi:oxidoreductase [Mycobacterium kansasii]|uniref:Phthalate 4,5-dioxygenase oxygenase reductase subunit n=1 Tax=Mycobacterium attenuatum TaxID=2341086 RepID=A0A498PYU7_9MYCO|nr:PDR/VanB family oxidoreductase [Mycobacterium attenuatum]ORB86459.1 oxidoreductase [Mycobacterium kansasii]VBA37433.1 Phthalate 4,5-dioxygenase oxygenase reductase subunit [Mycobacterium attenuatum]VBA50473.1 Phthalate 4,5-dioxygenase oxygenase reductase subunit [Mycobacterium attenuatum]VBA56191.1 Phthalate 4,5-dioxygenase oxygenase reductase subunit [Mycobacterium attenuatum]
MRRLLGWSSSTVPQSIWRSRPADLHGGGRPDRFATALWGVRTLLGGLASASRWDPSRVSPVRRTHLATIVKRQFVASDVVALTLAHPDGGLLPSWTPGAHIDVHLPSGRRRQYSLCGRPGRRTDYRIAVQRIADGGGGSVEMHEAYDVGDLLVFEGPRNAFCLGTAEQDLLFVIGGIGVTPILPMIQMAHQRGTDWRAVYAGRSRGHMPLLEEVMAVAPERVTVWADDDRGRFPKVDELLGDAGPRTAVYVCGPTPMLEAVCAARARHARAPLHYERFSPPPVVDGAPFEVEFGRSGRVLRIPANRSALDVMRDDDPTTAYSCQQGFCGTCKVKVLAGQVDHRGRAAEGDDEMLVCVSRAKSRRVVIDR